MSIPLQLAIYKRILEENFPGIQMKVGSLIHFPPSGLAKEGTYEVIQGSPLEEEVDYILDDVLRRRQEEAIKS